MIIFGVGNLYKYVSAYRVIDKIYNLNELIESVPKLVYLNPYSFAHFSFTSEEEFDKWYIQYLTTTPEAFKELMDILRHAYNGETVYIMCSWGLDNNINDIAENIIEALIKFIVDNYGYVCNVVRKIDDIQDLKEGTFSIEGIQQFDRNMETYIKYFGTRELPSTEM